MIYHDSDQVGSMVGHKNIKLVKWFFMVVMLFDSGVSAGEMNMCKTKQISMRGIEGS